MRLRGLEIISIASGQGWQAVFSDHDYLNTYDIPLMALALVEDESGNRCFTGIYPLLAEMGGEIRIDVIKYFREEAAKEKAE